MNKKTFTVRYYGSLNEYSSMIGCATYEDDWSGPDTTTYTVTLWEGRGVLKHVRHRSLEFGSATVWHGSPCICRCGGEHNRVS